jgi:hypothetical protein
MINKTPQRLINQYGTKGDYKLVTATQSVDVLNLSVTQSNEQEVPLHAVMLNNSTGDANNSGLKANQYLLLANVDVNFDGIVEKNAHIKHNNKRYNIEMSNPKFVRGELTYTEIIVNA